MLNCRNKNSRTKRLFNCSISDCDFVNTPLSAEFLSDIFELFWSEF